MRCNVKEVIRINKFLGEIGYCSRREADRLIEEKRIKINGTIAIQGDKTSREDKIEIDHKIIDQYDEKEILIYYKPRGIECTCNREIKENVIDAIDYNKRLLYAGRLDKNSEGLLIMTNEGSIINKMMRSGNQHEKEYIVFVNEKITKEFLGGMAKGVPILDTITKPCVIKKLEDKKFSIILTQGLNRQIRRMCSYFDYSVRELKRIRVMNIELGELKSGEYRKISSKERLQLEELIRESYNDYNDLVEK